MDLAKALGEKFFAVLNLALSDVQLLLQDHDLGNDAIRRITNQVRIERLSPSQPSPTFVCVQGPRGSCSPA